MSDTPLTDACEINASGGAFRDAAGNVIDGVTYEEDLCDRLRRLERSLKWTDATKRLPDEEGRYWVVYRYKDGRQEKPYIGDFDPPEERWNGLPLDCEVIYWQAVPEWRQQSSGSTENG
jgi:hypothetical protein